MMGGGCGRAIELRVWWKKIRWPRLNVAKTGLVLYSTRPRSFHDTTGTYLLHRTVRISLHFTSLHFTSPCLKCCLQPISLRSKPRLFISPQDTYLPLWGPRSEGNSDHDRQYPHPVPACPCTDQAYIFPHATFKIKISVQYIEFSSSWKSSSGAKKGQRTKDVSVAFTCTPPFPPPHSRLPLFLRTRTA